MLKPYTNFPSFPFISRTANCSYWTLIAIALRISYLIDLKILYKWKVSFMSVFFSGEASSVFKKYNNTICFTKPQLGLKVHCAKQSEWRDVIQLGPLARREHQCKDVSPNLRLQCPFFHELWTHSLSWHAFLSMTWRSEETHPRHS